MTKPRIRCKAWRHPWDWPSHPLSEGYENAVLSEGSTVNAVSSSAASCPPRLATPQPSPKERVGPAPDDGLTIPDFLRRTVAEIAR